MSTPALIYLALVCVGLGVSATKNGQPRAGKHSFIGAVVGTGVILGLLYWGGFFARVTQ